MIAFTKKILMLTGALLALGTLVATAQLAKVAGVGTTALPPPEEPIYLVLSITDVEPGTLADRVAEYNILDRLRITGSLNGDDINCLRDLDCSTLVYLDLSGCRIVGEGTFKQGTYATESVERMGGHIIIWNPNDMADGTIGRGMLASLTTLETIILPNTVTRIEASALRDCPNLKSVTIGAATIELSSCCVFTGCSSLTEVKFGSGSRYAEEGNIVYTDNGRTALMALPAAMGEVSLLGSVDSIAPYAFYDRPDITSVDLPQDLRAIGSYAFYNTGIKTLTLPPSMTHIDKGVFWKCGQLTTVDFPAAIDSIDLGAFAACDLREIDLSKTQLRTLVGNNSSHSASVLYWYVSAFEDNQNLMTVRLPKTLTHIGRNAFNSALLADIYCPATTPPSMYFVHYTPPSDDDVLRPIIIGPSVMTYSSSLTNVDTLTCRVHVPSVALADYSVAHGWRAFLKNMVADLPGDVEYQPYAGSGDDLQDYLDSFGETVDELARTTYQEVKVWYTRQFRNTAWQPLYVPLQLTYDDWSGCFEVARLTGTSRVGDNVQLEGELLTAADGDLQANTPYLIRAKKTGTYTIEVSGDKLADPAEATVSLTPNDFYVKGTTNGYRNLKTSGWYCLMGGALRQPNSDDYYLPPFRWYLKTGIPYISPIMLRIAGSETTAVDGVTMATNGDGWTGRPVTVYDLKGRRVKTCETAGLKTLPKGIYIVNGRKVTVK